MNIEGTYTLQARPEEIRRSLADAEVLRRAIPGLEQLERSSEDRYTVAIHIKHAPLLGTYRGQVSIKEDQQPNHYHFVIESDGSANTISGIGTVQLHEMGANTTISYRGTLTIGKRGTRLSPAVTKGAAKLLIQQFFTALADQLRIDKEERRTEEVVGAEVIRQSGGEIVILPPTSTPEEVTPAPVAQKIVNLLRLGADDPVQKGIWTNRIRRMGLVSGFLLLVWIGTRLPRKSV